MKTKIDGIYFLVKVENLMKVKGISCSSGKFLYMQIKNEFGNLTREDFLQEVANAKDLSVYAQYYLDTLDLEPFEFSEYVAKTHDAKFCYQFSWLENSNKEILFNEIVTSNDGKVCFDYLVENENKIDEDQRYRLKLAILNSGDAKLIFDCYSQGDFFNSEELELAKFAFRASATPKKVKAFEAMIQSEEKELQM